MSERVYARAGAPGGDEPGPWQCVHDLISMLIRRNRALEMRIAALEAHTSVEARVAALEQRTENSDGRRPRLWTPNGER